MKRAPRVVLHRAFDAARFGPSRTLDLRASLPSAEEAVRRTEAWLRERQMLKAGEVLVITGRGNGSPGGVGIVREAVRRLLSSLQRRGVVSSVGVHTPGSFVVTLAPVRALFETARRSRGRVPHVPPADPAELGALTPETRARLRWLAERSLEVLGAPRSEPFVLDEMRRQFAILSSTIAPGESDREGRLQFLIASTQDAFDGGE